MKQAMMMHPLTIGRNTRQVAIKHRATGGSVRSLLLLAISVVMPCGSAALATAPSQEDVFKSIQNSVSGEVDSPDVLPVIAGIGGLLLLLVVIAHRKKRVAVARPVNHQGKLLREVLKTVPLRTREVKQLKLLAENADTDGPQQPSPLTLLLCPSLMAKTIQTKRLKVDRRALASIARKAGLQVTRK